MEYLGGYIILVRGVIAFVLSLSGLYALYGGLRLFISGVGIHTDEAKVELGPYKVSTKTVGSTIMVTASAWGLLAFWSLPSLKSSDLEITSNYEEKFDRLEVLVAERVENQKKFEAKLLDQNQRLEAEVASVTNNIDELQKLAEQANFDKTNYPAIWTAWPVQGNFPLTENGYPVFVIGKNFPPLNAPKPNTNGFPKATDSPPAPPASKKMAPKPPKNH
ncbi:MAG: hypothetical protein HUJ26_23555 [Planctomycetaceae bacterium]|nr:hypothetical protein [Planctomycetaceae bacterium]